MVRRIIGQCNTTNFKELEHLSTLVHRGEEIDRTNLTKRQRVAITVLRHFQLCGVSFDVVLKLREVLVWEMPDKGLAFEYKLLNSGDTATLEILSEMTPRKVGHGKRS